MNVLIDIRVGCFVFYYFACLFHIFYILTFVGKIFMYLCKTGWEAKASNKKIKRNRKIHEVRRKLWIKRLTNQIRMLIQTI